MKTSSRKTASRKDCSKRPQRNLARLGGYVATTVGAGILATPAAEAAVIPIDIGPSGFNIGGPNGNVPPNNSNTVYPFPFTGQGDLGVVNANVAYGFTITGVGPSVWGSYGLRFATGGVLASPVKFGQNALIDASATWSSYPELTFFEVDNGSGLYKSPDFGPNSYLGFQTADGYFGYLEVTWDGGTSTFEILSGAYEDVQGVGITTPGGPTAVPEIDPSGFASVASMAIGSLAMLEQRRRKRAAAATATVTATTA